MKPIKIKKYGKNQRALKKLLADENTKVFQDGVDFKRILEKLIGYDYSFKLIDGGLELRDPIGDEWIIETNLPLEII